MELDEVSKVSKAVPDVFLCGPLTHVPLLEIILGRGVAAGELAPATLRDHDVQQFAGQPGATVLQAPGLDVLGAVIPITSATELARLDHYQTGYGLSGRSLEVVPKGRDAIRALAYVSQDDAWGPPGLAWDNQAWVLNWSEIACAAAREIMAQVSALTGDQIARRLTGVHIRAASFVAAQARSVGATRDLKRDIVVHAHHRKYSNFFAAEELDLQYRRYDGEMSAVLNRGAQMLGRAAVVLPYDPEQDAVLMVEQFRAPLFMGGDRDPWLWQPVAGLVDPGETPEVAAHRETLEEAGLEMSALFAVAGAYSSPGANSDFVSLFVGLGDFSTRTAGGGLADEGEDIKVRVVGFDDLMADIDQGRYRDMQLVLTSLWLARHRHRWR